MENICCCLEENQRVTCLALGGPFVDDLLDRVLFFVTHVSVGTWKLFCWKLNKTKGDLDDKTASFSIFLGVVKKQQQQRRRESRKRVAGIDRTTYDFAEVTT